jgi:hypothetical protein
LEKEMNGLPVEDEECYNSKLDESEIEMEKEGDDKISLKLGE